MFSNPCSEPSESVSEEHKASQSTSSSAATTLRKLVAPRDRLANMEVS